MIRSHGDRNELTQLFMALLAQVCICNKDLDKLKAIQQKICILKDNQSWLLEFNNISKRCSSYFLPIDIGIIILFSSDRF